MAHLDICYSSQGFQELFFVEQTRTNDFAFSSQAGARTQRAVKPQADPCVGPMRMLWQLSLTGLSATNHFARKCIIFFFFFFQLAGGNVQRARFKIKP